ncbi:MAG: hypothetical protein HY553_12790 [Elusimicrobia bacterium]|nr:hypothetical protein [Elusimicrobiota bacterium]
MVLGLLWALLAFPAAGEVAILAGPRTLDAPGLDAFYDNTRARAERGAALGSRPRAGAVRFNGLELPSVAFPGRRPVTELLVQAIDKTEASLRLMLYELNQEAVWAALQRAVERRPPVQVEVLLDSSHAFPYGREASPQIQALLKDPRFKVRVQRGFDEYGTNHNKFALFDGKMVEYGSYNWTNAAENKNFENALFSTDGGRVGLYHAYFDWCWKHASPPTGPAEPPTLTGKPPVDPTPTVSFNGVLLPRAVFSPAGGTAAWLAKTIGASKETIDVAMFSFYDQSLGEALLERKRAGLKIRVVLDRNQAARSPVARYLKEQGFELRLSRGRDGSIGVMHHKYAVFDGKLVETGSFNWSNNAEHNNFENSNFLPEPGIVSEFKSEFERVWKQAVDAKTVPDADWAAPPPLQVSPVPWERSNAEVRKGK